MRKTNLQFRSLNYTLTDLSNLKGIIGEYVSPKFLNRRGFRTLCWNGALLPGLRMSIPTKKVKKLISIDDYLESEKVIKLSLGVAILEPG